MTSPLLPWASPACAERALKPLRGEGGLSPSSVSGANKALKEAFNNWRNRDLSTEEIIYLFLDGLYLGVRGSSQEKEVKRLTNVVGRSPGEISALIEEVAKALERSQSGLNSWKKHWLPKRID